VPDDTLAWSVAWERAAVGPAGFYQREGPYEHFATSITRSSELAARLAALMSPRLAALIQRYGSATVTDAGAATGVLLQQVRAALDPDIAEQLAWRAVDVRPRPTALPDGIEWVHGDARQIATAVAPGPGVLIAHELLDDVPCDILEIDEGCRRRLVLVDPATGHEELGPDSTDLSTCARLGVDASHIGAWCDRWWPRREPAARVEVGLSRDILWHSLASTISDGLAVAIDYGHVQDERDSGLWDGGTLTAFRGGRAVSVVPDGSANLTAHVAMDSCAEAGPPGTSTLDRSQEGLWTLVRKVGR
jgi:SAM-dependent MidA family methyltransferase